MIIPFVDNFIPSPYEIHTIEKHTALLCRWACLPSRKKIEWMQNRGRKINAGVNSIVMYNYLEILHRFSHLCHFSVFERLNI
jgi:hypothetical protein